MTKIRGKAGGWRLEAGVSTLGNLKKREENGLKEAMRIYKEASPILRPIGVKEALTIRAGGESALVER